MILQDATVLKAVEEKAESLLGAALDKHKAARMTLPDERRQLYRQVSRQAKRSTPESWELPPSIDVSKDGNGTYKRHLYADDAGDFRCQLNQWEQQVIEEELKKKEHWPASGRLRRSSLGAARSNLRSRQLGAPTSGIG